MPKDDFFNIAKKDMEKTTKQLQAAKANGDEKRIARLTQTSKNLDELIAYFNGGYKVGAKAIESTGDEVVADFYASKVISKILTNKSVSADINILTGSFASFCPNSKLKPKKAIPLGKADPEHPPTWFRIENIIRNPEVSRELGCRNQNTKKWCDL